VDRVGKHPLAALQSLSVLHRNDSSRDSLQNQHDRRGLLSWCVHPARGSGTRI